MYCQSKSYRHKNRFKFILQVLKKIGNWRQILSKGGGVKSVFRKISLVLLIFSPAWLNISCKLKLVKWSIIRWLKIHNSFLATVIILSDPPFSLQLFSSPEPKAQLSFSNWNLSVVWRCSSCHKLFTFSSSSPEPLGQFQPNLSQTFLGEGGSI